MKKDIKYIIKKIIIGVGITFGVMLIKSLPVFAEEKEQIASCQFGRNPTSQFVSYKNDCTKYIQNVGLKKDPDNFNEALTYEFPFYDATFHFKYETSQTNSKYMIYYDEENNSYIIIYLYTDGKNAKFSTKGTGNDTQFIYTGDTSYSVSYYNYTNIITPKQIEKYEKMYNNSNNNIIKTEISNDKSEKLYLYQYDNGALTSLQSYGSVEMFNPKNLKLIKTNFENVYVEDEKINVEELDKTPTGYEKIDMFNKYAILFYPKDFRNLPIECTKSKDGVTTDDDGNVTVIPNKTCLEESYKFTFYYSGYFNTAFTDLSVMDVVKNPVEQLTFPPTAKPYELPLLRNINDFKGGIMFYNNSLSQITDDDGNVTTYYDKGYIYYDSSLFNYVIIEDYDTTPNQDISWIDKDGNTQNANINNIPKKNQTTLNEAQDTFDLFKNFKTNDHGLSSIITAPLSFIKNLSSATCTSVVLPIPFSKNQNVKLPCLTTMYEEKASSVYNIYKIVITGITAYWVCVRIYALVKGFKDPNDDKIEVMEL